MTGGRLRRVLAALAVVLAVVGSARPAAADAAGPTDYRSEVTGADPALPEGVSARVVGGDAFLELTVDGHEVVVLDYAAADGEAVPYLRFSPDGTVEENEASAASVSNESRYGTSTAVPDPDGEPRWREVAADGTYAWHDHRIHWMAPSRAPRTGADGTVDLGGPDGGWTVDLVVDDVPTTLTGSLRVVPSPPRWPAALAVVALVVAGLVLAARRGPRPLLAAGGLVGVAAMGVSYATWSTGPAHARPSAIPMVVALAAVVAAVVGLVVGRPQVRLIATAVAAAGLVGWALTRIGVLAHAVLPTDLAPGVDRAATVLALGVGLAIAGFLVWQPTAQSGQGTG